MTGLGDEELPALMLRAGEQYLDLRGEVERDVLAFLPAVLSDLHAREALLRAGTIIVDEFRYAVVSGREIEHAQELVPPAFVGAVDRKLAVDLFAASIALLARLSADEPAGCVGEEIVAISLLSEARAWLEMRAERDEISRDAQRDASSDLEGLFELFQDADVLRMFEMQEPADAAVARDSWIDEAAGIADQRVSAWFLAFGGTATTGYLHEPPDGPP
jgi:hypothetical protein